VNYQIKWTMCTWSVITNLNLDRSILLTVRVLLYIVVTSAPRILRPTSCIRKLKWALHIAARLGETNTKWYHKYMIGFCMLSSGWFAGTWSLYAEVLEHSVCSIFIGTHLPTKMEQAEYTETLAYKLQMPVNHPEESIKRSEYDESLKSRMRKSYSVTVTLTQLFFVPHIPYRPVGL
jgi:transposase